MVSASLKLHDVFYFILQTCCLRKIMNRRTENSMDIGIFTIQSHPHVRVWTGVCVGVLYQYHSKARV